MTAATDTRELGIVASALRLGLAPLPPFLAKLIQAAPAPFSDPTLALFASAVRRARHNGCSAANFVSTVDAEFRRICRSAEHKEPAPDYVERVAEEALPQALAEMDAELLWNQHQSHFETSKPKPVPRAECATPRQGQEKTTAPPPATAELSCLILPGGSVPISESARAIFSRIGSTNEIFWRGGALVELVEQDGTPSLELLRPEGFRSRVERFGDLFAWRKGQDGEAVLKRSLMSGDTANALMATREARELLPPITSVLRCPVLIETEPGEVTVLGKGYHREGGGLHITAGELPKQAPLDEAARSLRWLIEEFEFQSEGDRSRALAALLTPALRIGGHLREPIPITVVEADQSQAGKGFFLTLVSALYGESAYVVAERQGGVGSADESFAAALVSGRPFVMLDNVRGKVVSAYLESFLTAPGLFPARIPHRGEIQIDPRRFILAMTSNGVETTRDLANRSSIIRIRKRPGFAYRDSLAELERRQPHFLGCVFSVLASWLGEGKPRTLDMRHDFREWSQSLDWIVRNLLGAAPLMDGHSDAQERVSNPALVWLRSVALALEGEKRLGRSLIAGDLAETCELHGIEIPAGRAKDSDGMRRQIGILMRRLFGESDFLDVDGFSVTRRARTYQKPSGDWSETPEYVFAPPSKPAPPHSTPEGVLL